MSLGASFALSQEQLASLLSCSSDEERVAWLDELEESASDDTWFEFDKAWDALHRCLGDGGLEISPDGPPLSRAVFGSRPLMQDEATPVFAGLLPAEEIPAVADALSGIDEAWLPHRYRALDQTEYGQPLGDDDFDYTWDALGGLKGFLSAAGRSGRAVVFTVAD